ncbi:MAG: hypothetical protein AB1449_10505 [Chloroflexota bacterium]
MTKLRVVGDAQVRLVGRGIENLGEGWTSRDGGEVEFLSIDCAIGIDSSPEDLAPQQWGKDAVSGIQPKEQEFASIRVMHSVELILDRRLDHKCRPNERSARRGSRDALRHQRREDRVVSFTPCHHEQTAAGCDLDLHRSWTVKSDCENGAERVAGAAQVPGMDIGWGEVPTVLPND